MNGTMRAAVLHAPGPPDSFTIEAVPVPVPGPDEVLIEVGACGVSYRDVVERNGTYRRDTEFPAILGLEISGTVVEAGADVVDLKIGDTICTKAFISCGRCRLCRSGRETTCRRRRPVKGGYAQYVALAQDACVAFPKGLAFETMCSVGPGAGVALNAVRDTARVTIGDTVLVTGATGGVGVPSVQIARAAGARVIAVSRSEAKADFLREIGADDVIIAGDGENFAGQVKAITDGAGVDVVIDNVGSRVFNACFDSLAVHGRYAIVGQLFGEEVSINPARIFFKRAAILGVGSVSRAQLADAIDLVARGIVTPRVDTILPLEEVARAHEIVEGGAAAGRVVLKP
ncbi:quinone oxidoreductase family protein [Sphingosinithalassobacter portus]|uniref:quinone oxidoreductase family protein n=1 Tax=Stakelama portus TaxID=2676234 RepID=UPI000D6E697D|nr:zinc-binding dehydrogenase [Sphingosinithalassobacter portus]